MYLNQLQRERVFTYSWRVSPILREVLKDNLVVRRGWVQARTQGGRDTLFHETRVVPYENVITDADRALFALPTGTVEENKPQLFGRLFEAICAAIVVAWKPQMHHIFLMSSGWDTRIMSWALTRLAQVRGQSWLGDLLFVCVGPETSTAGEALRYEGWSDEQIWMVSDPALWLWPVLDPETLAPTINGTHAIVPMTRYFVTGLALERTGWQRNDTQVIGGFGSDYGLHGAGRDIFFETMHDCYRAATSIPLRAAPDEILPWLNRDVLTVARESSVRRAFELRQEMVQWLDTKLAAFPRVDDSWPAFPDKLKERAVSWYAGSWYGKYIGAQLGRIAASKEINSGESVALWSHWTAAVYCQKLIEDGYHLEAE